MPTNSRRKGPVLMYQQCQVAHALAQCHRCDINKEVDAVIDYAEQDAICLSKKFKKSIPWFKHQFFQGGRMTHQKRAMNVFNVAQQIEGFLDGCKRTITEDEKKMFQEIQAKLKQLNGAKNAAKLPIEIQQFLKAKTQAWRDEKHTAPWTSTRAVVQDTIHSLDQLSDEVGHLCYTSE
ncbi:hypothetical protein K439DRAFT_1615298 [Ramaria rubella]|nr:hypothetical protein K439DRAFT_1615298 [Ramaria rubella]